MPLVVSDGHVVGAVALVTDQPPLMAMPAVGGNALLLETGGSDALLLETGGSDELLLE